ncbi:2,3-diaminopropionate biosynthesis protein SbnB [Sutcliffiella cohnii]
MEKVFALHHEGDYVLPNKSVLRWGDLDSESTIGRINSMPAYIGGDFKAVGIKWIASSPKNPQVYGLPRANGLTVLNDPDTLIPISVMDGTLLSAMRTGANSGVAAKYLAKKDSKTIGLIGAGVQNRTQLLALLEVMENIQTIKVCDLDAERANKFAKEMSEMTGHLIQVVPNAEEAVRGSDIFVTATVTKKPIVKREWIEKGSLYLHVGSHECEFDVIEEADKVVVDDWEELKHRGVETISIMYAQGIYDGSKIHANLGELVSGKKAGRENDNEIIYFNSVGLGIQDVALSSIIYKNALEKGIGTKLSLCDVPAFV